MLLDYGKTRLRIAFLLTARLETLRTNSQYVDLGTAVEHEHIRMKTEQVCTECPESAQRKQQPERGPGGRYTANALQIHLESIQCMNE